MRTFALRRVYGTRNCEVCDASPDRWTGFSQPYGDLTIEAGVNLAPKPGLPLPVSGGEDLVRGQENVRTLALHTTLEGTGVVGPVTELIVWADDVDEIDDDDRMVFRSVLDLFAVALGASNSRQFLAFDLGEDEWHRLPDGKWQCRVSRPASLIEHPTPRHEDVQRQTLDWVTGRRLNQDVISGGVLPWLLRAWRERDLVARFIALFIPLEMLLKGKGGGTSASKPDLAQIKRAVLASGVEDAERLANLLDTLQPRRPSLADRFAVLAQELSPGTAETDVAAFRKFNRMRNELVHQGRLSLETQVRLGEGDVVHLQDLTERYVYASLFPPHEDHGTLEAAP